MDDLSYSAEERIRISATDYVIAAFTLQPEQTILCVTQNGKVIQREAGFVDAAKSAASRGQALIAFIFYNRVEAAKIALSNEGATVISLDDKDIVLWELYTRTQFETDIFDYVGQVEKVLLETLSAAGLEPGQIEAVVKTGGSSSIPLFTALLERIFGAQKVKAANAFSSVVAGLAIKASGRSFSPWAANIPPNHPHHQPRVAQDDGVNMKGESPIGGGDKKLAEQD